MVCRLKAFILAESLMMFINCLLLLNHLVFVCFMSFLCIVQEGACKLFKANMRSGTVPKANICGI